MNTRRTPFGEIERVFERLNEQFETVDLGGSGVRPSGSLAVDVVDHDDEFVVTVDLPGYDREDVELEVTERRLHLTAEREESSEETDDEAHMRYLHHERRQLSTERTVDLPAAIDVEAVTARMHNGVLTITLPTLAGDDAHEIAIDGE